MDRLNVSINIYVSSFDSLEETSMDYRITFFLVSFSSDEGVKSGRPIKLKPIAPSGEHQRETQFKHV